MDRFTHTDDELAERISRGDWAQAVEPPAIDDVLREVQRRQRLRRTSIGAAVVTGLVAAAAAVTAVVGHSPDNPSAGVPPAQHPSVSLPKVDTPSVSDPATPVLPRVGECGGRGVNLLLTNQPSGGTPQRPTQGAAIKNIGRRDCLISALPTLSIGTKSGAVYPVDMRSAGDGPWKLRPHQALILTVTAPRPSSCIRTGGPALAHQFILTEGQSSSTFSFPRGMKVAGCAPPALTDARVTAPRN